MHLAHRFHSTFTLGFTRPDPSRQELNNYNYAACDPVNNTDPSGLNACNFVTLVGVVATGAALAGAAPLSLILGVPAAVGGVICIGMWINDQAVAAAQVPARHPRRTLRVPKSAIRNFTETNRQQRPGSMIDTPTIISVVSFLLAFTLAVIYMTKKEQASTLNRRMLTGSVVILILTSIFFLIYSVFTS
ncbi:hypothetical protein HFP72_30355 [Nocardiopsis sp. ARC36]